MSSAIGVTTLDLTIIGAYFLLVIGAGVALSRHASRSLSSYFLGGNRIPWWAIGMSGTASNFDISGTMVITSFYFAIGLQAFWVSMRGAMALPLGVLMVYMGKWLRRSQVMTTAEWMELRFGHGPQGRTARLLSAVANLIFTMSILVYFTKGAGKFLATFLPFSPAACALLMIAVAVLYTTLSGFYGVIYTDVLQELLLVGVSLYVGYTAFTLPNHEQLLAAVQLPTWHSFVPAWRAEPMSWLGNPQVYQAFGVCIVFWVGKGIFVGMGGFIGGYTPQRYYAAASERDAGLFTAEWSLLTLLRWLLIVGIVLLALDLTARSPELGQLLRRDPEQTLPVVLMHAIPPGVRGMLLAGMMAAGMSTFDSAINAGVSYWVRDIYQLHIRRQATQRQLMHQSYIATVCFALAATMMSLTVHNIDDIWSFITGPLSAGVALPTFLRWYWWRFTGFGFAAGTAGGLLTSLVLRAAVPQLPFYSAFIAALALSLVLSIAVSLASPPADMPTLEAFFARIRPFGLWGVVRQRMAPDLRRTAQRENAIDGANLFVGLGWHVCGVMVVIALMLHKWSTAGTAAALWAVLGLLLYLCWYRNLQSRQEAQAAMAAGR